MRGSRSRRLVGIIVGVLAVAVVAFLAVGLIFEDSWPGRLLQGTAIQTTGAQPGYIPPKSAVTVDGNAGEWAGDSVFANMYRAGSPSKPIEAHLYLRYHCTSSTLYALVLSAGDWPMLVQSTSEAWIKINGTRVDFNQMAWIDQGYDGSNDHAKGWEAAFTLQQGDYSIQAHTNAFHDGESQTADSTNVSMSIICGGTTAVELASFTAEWASLGGQGVVLTWETASEIDNVGFNLYRATNRTGPWLQLNKQLIPSQAPPGSPVGATYQWNDAEAIPGQRYLYVLEDVDVSGIATKHDPIRPPLLTDR